MKEVPASLSARSAFGVVCGAHSAASKCHRVAALKRTTMRGSVHGRSYHDWSRYCEVGVPGGSRKQIDPAMRPAIELSFGSRPIDRRAAICFSEHSGHRSLIANCCRAPATWIPAVCTNGTFGHEIIFAARLFLLAAVFWEAHHRLRIRKFEYNECY
jgi:hypothetical protein